MYLFCCLFVFFLIFTCWFLNAIFRSSCYLLFFVRFLQFSICSFNRFFIFRSGYAMTFLFANAEKREDSFSCTKNRTIRFCYVFGSYGNTENALINNITNSGCYIRLITLQLRWTTDFAWLNQPLIIILQIRAVILD